MDQIFRIFDKDGNGSIDFKEFMMATDMTSAGTPEEKLKWTFKVDATKSANILPMIDSYMALGRTGQRKINLFNFWSPLLASY